MNQRNPHLPCGPSTIHVMGTHRDAAPLLRSHREFGRPENTKFPNNPRIGFLSGCITIMITMRPGTSRHISNRVSSVAHLQRSVHFRVQNPCVHVNSLRARTSTLGSPRWPTCGQPQELSEALEDAFHMAYYATVEAAHGGSSDWSERVSSEVASSVSEP
jgi:hypothetical protein